MREESNVTGATVDSETVIETLNKFLRGELSAVETYDQALDRLRTSSFAADLAECRRSHQERVDLLRQQVVRLGGKPSDSSGVWGGFARLVEGSAKLFGEKAALAALEEGEDHGLRLYRNELNRLDAVTRDLIERSLLPAQQRSHQVMSTLKNSVH
jgi:uncharacterized protein (TIGR02284 family)